MGRFLNANDPVAEDDVEGHDWKLNANEPVADDTADVEAHGLLRNAAIAAALTVGGGAAVASPASAGPVEDATTIVHQAATPEAVSTFIWDMYGRSVPPENLQASIWDGLPADLRATGSAQQIVTYIVQSVPPEKLQAVTEEVVGNEGPYWLVGNYGGWSSEELQETADGANEVLGGPRNRVTEAIPPWPF